MDPSASTSKETSNIIYDSETMRLLDRLSRKIREELENTSKNKNVRETEDRVSILTGVHSNSIKALSDDLDLEGQLIRPVDRSMIHNMYVNLCLVGRVFPTTNNLFDYLHKQLPFVMDRAAFRRLLAEMGFVWKNTKSGTLCVIERPDITFERYNYLNKLKKYQSLPTYYIDENYAAEKNAESLNFISAYEGAITNAIYKLCFALTSDNIEACAYLNDFTEETFENYIMDNLLPTLNGPSLIIFSNAPHHCQLVSDHITIHSLKSEMIDFMEANYIPYHADMSKFELFTVIKKFVNGTTRKYKIDSILEARGHKVLRIPVHLEKLTPATYLRPIIDRSLSAIKRDTPDVLWEVAVGTVIINSDKVLLKKIFDYVMRQVDRLIETDKIIDDTWDEIVSKSCESKPNYVDTDFADFSDEE